MQAYMLLFIIAKFGDEVANSAFHIARKGGFSIVNRQIGDKSPLKNALLSHDQNQ